VLLRDAPRGLDPLLADDFAAATDDAARLRVVVDQVAQLTDVSAAAMLARLTS
jgi:dGTPase